MTMNDFLTLLMLKLCTVPKQWTNKEIQVAHRAHTAILNVWNTQTFTVFEVFLGQSV